MKIRKQAALILVALTASAMASCGKGTADDCVLLTEGMAYTVTEKGVPLEYYSLSYDIIGGDAVMPVGIFAGPNLSGGSDDGNAQPDFISDKYFSLMQEAGINLSVYTTWFYEKNVSAYQKMLALGEKYGIGFYVPSTATASLIGTRTEGTVIESVDAEMLRNKILNISDRLNYRSFVGLWVYDEPFPHWQLQNTKTIAEAIQDLNLPDVSMYCNIVGYWDGEFNFWNTCAPTIFDDYAESFMEIGFPMLSATQYPYDTHWPDLDEEKQNSLLKDELFRLLGVYRSLAMKYKVPAWRMMQAGGDWAKDSVGYYPNEGEFLYDVNCSLAFGMKGIQYYTGFQHPGDGLNSDGTYDTYRSGLFGMDGNLNEWYYYAKKANAQLHAVDHVLMQSANTGVLVSGEKTKALVGDPLSGTMFEGEELIVEGNYKELKSVSGEALIGCFDYQGGTALYVVNGSNKAKNDVTLSFDGRYAYDVTQRAQTTAVTGTSFTLTLEAGEGALVVLR